MKITLTQSLLNDDYTIFINKKNAFQWQRNSQIHFYKSFGFSHKANVTQHLGGQIAVTAVA